ncbi:hypothetical protein DFQ28_009396 [Apophysomyces sp. BC1034]|nr:hypothetical protein DFQ30_008461 [Apophysomyces sp. BC1015]KAG0174596.1 hypothetical protein DFQ29_007431 [Apophysomyces sp. BC1021]KAG0185398.1 hypothetical protein DFQ28_009396 [Apophysomyces sp. BC1034]
MMVKTPQGFDTGKIGQVNAIVNAFFKKTISLDNCLCSLDEVVNAPLTCGCLTTLLAFAGSSFAGSALMFHGSWIDAAVSGALGLFVGMLFTLASEYPIYGRIFEISASVMVAIIARALHQYVCFTSVAVSAILILLPGYGMTLAVMEISARHITTGTVRLVYAVVYAFMLAYGLQVGSTVYSAINPDAPDEGTCRDPVSPWFYIPLLPVLSISISMCFGSSKKQWLSQTFCAAIGFSLCYFMSQVIPDAHIVGSIASFAVSLYSNVALKFLGEAPLAPMCVGITLLVPGSIGVKGAYALLHQDDVSHSLFPLQMLTIALGLSVGLFAAAMIVYPSGKRYSLYISL